MTDRNTRISRCMVYKIPDMALLNRLFCFSQDASDSENVMFQHFEDLLYIMLGEFASECAALTACSTDTATPRDAGALLLLSIVFANTLALTLARARPSSLLRLVGFVLLPSDTRPPHILTLLQNLVLPYHALMDRYTLRTLGCSLFTNSVENCNAVTQPVNAAKATFVDTSRLPMGKYSDNHLYSAQNSPLTLLAQHNTFGGVRGWNCSCCTTSNALDQTKCAACGFQMSAESQKAAPADLSKVIDVSMDAAQLPNSHNVVMMTNVDEAIKGFALRKSIFIYWFHKLTTIFSCAGSTGGFVPSFPHFSQIPLCSLVSLGSSVVVCDGHLYLASISTELDFEKLDAASVSLKRTAGQLLRRVSLPCSLELQGQSQEISNTAKLAKDDVFLNPERQHHYVIISQLAEGVGSVPKLWLISTHTKLPAVAAKDFDPYSSTLFFSALSTETLLPISSPQAIVLPLDNSALFSEVKVLHSNGVDARVLVKHRSTGESYQLTQVVAGPSASTWQLSGRLLEREAYLRATALPARELLPGLYSGVRVFTNSSGVRESSSPDAVNPQDANMTFKGSLRGLQLKQVK